MSRKEALIANAVESQSVDRPMSSNNPRRASGSPSDALLRLSNQIEPYGLQMSTHGLLRDIWNAPANRLQNDTVLLDRNTRVRSALAGQLAASEQERCKKSGHVQEHAIAGGLQDCLVEKVIVAHQVVAVIGRFSCATTSASIAASCLSFRRAAERRSGHSARSSVRTSRSSIRSMFLESRSTGKAIRPRVQPAT